MRLLKNFYFVLFIFFAFTCLNACEYSNNGAYMFGTFLISLICLIAFFYIKNLK